MNEFFSEYIVSARTLAARHSLDWHPTFDERGAIARDERWNLTTLAGLAPPPTVWLTDFGSNEPLRATLNAIERQRGRGETSHVVMPPGWRDLYQAILVHAILVEGRRPDTALWKLGRAVRALAMCASSPHPWQMNRDDVELAYNVMLRCAESGTYGLDLEAVVRKLDTLHLLDVPQLARFCKPYSDQMSLARQEKVVLLRKTSDHRRSTRGVIEQLLHRKDSHKLPKAKAFWELVRIVFTEQPQSFVDCILFAALKLALVTGFRVDENALIPLDCQRWLEHRDSNGLPCGKSGGFSRSLMIRYFAKKQPKPDDPRGQVLVERVQHVPPMFEDLVAEVLTEAARITEPLRVRLRRQTEEGRMFPEYDLDCLVPAVEMATRMAGQTQLSDEAIPEELIRKYRSTYDVLVLEEIRQRQMDVINSNLSVSTGKRIRKDGCNISKTLNSYLSTHRSQNGLVFRDVAGVPLTSRRLKWTEAYLRIGDVEEWMRVHNPRKLPDTTPFLLPKGGVLFPYELLFLVPQLTSGIDNIVDVDRYAGVGRLNAAALMLVVGNSEVHRDLNLFARYGRTEEDRRLTLTVHALRHLQNTELLRLGVADAIVTKRFGRNSVQQTAVYDHRTHAELLDSIELPKDAESRLGPRGQETLRMIMAKKVRGPVVDEFRRIQRELGDDAAFDYLDGEADGLHVTPYGFCLNSFTVDPCPKHLECFNGCRHLARTDLPQEHVALMRLRDRLVRVIAKVEATPSGSVGRENQLRHAQTRLANLEIALASAPGSKPFPDGPDLASPFGQVGPTALDTPARTLRLVHD